MLPYTTAMPCSGLGVRNNFTGILNDLRSNHMFVGVNSNPVTALIQPNPLQIAVNVNNNNKDSQWLTLEVCREYQRNMCPRNELECKYAHPPSYIETQNGRVMCCYDSIKGKCHRIKPPCKYLHPPQHLKDLLIQNGKNNLLMKNLQMNLMQQQFSNISGNPQSRLGFLSVNNSSKVNHPSQLNSVMAPLIIQKTGIENQTLSSPEQTDLSTSDQTNQNKSINDNCCVSNDATYTQTNLNRFSNVYECQSTQYMPNSISSTRNTPMLTTAINDTHAVDLKNSRKRQLPMCNVSTNKNEQSSDKPSPFKKLNLLDSQVISGINREQQSNQLGIMMNPLIAYQNQLASLLSLNNQTSIPNNSLNLQTLLTPNNGGMVSLGSSLICPNTLVNLNGFPMISTLPNQQQLATMLQAVNAMQYSRTFADLNSFP